MCQFVSGSISLQQLTRPARTTAAGTWRRCQTNRYPSGLTTSRPATRRLSSTSGNAISRSSSVLLGVTRPYSALLEVVGRGQTFPPLAVLPPRDMLGGREVARSCSDLRGSRVDGLGCFVRVEPVSTRSPGDGGTAICGMGSPADELSADRVRCCM